MTPKMFYSLPNQESTRPTLFDALTPVNPLRRVSDAIVYAG